MCMSIAQACAKRLSLWEDLVEVLVKSSVTKALLRRSCGDPAEIIKDVLAWSLQVPEKRSCRDPDEMRSFHGLVQALVRRSWSQILWVSLHGLFWSFWEDLLEFLFKSSLRGIELRSWRCSAWSCPGPSQKILWRSWWAPLQEVMCKTGPAHTGCRREWLHHRNLQWHRQDPKQ